MQCNQQDKLLVSWTLTLVLMMTPWLSFWTTPVLAVQHGEQMVLCTLQGLKAVTTGQNDQQIEDSTGHCPALQLLQAFSQTAHTNSDNPPYLHHSAVPNTDNIHYFYTVPHLSVYAGRAPPLS